MAPNFEEAPGSSKRLKEEILYRFHSKEGHEFTMEKAAAELSGVVKQISQDLGIDDDESIRNMKPIPLINVSSEAFHYVVKWCEQHKTMPPWEQDKWWLNERDEEMKKWENEFLGGLTSEQLFDAANYMDIKCLLDKCAETVAGMIKGKSVEEIREIWELENDFTPEEEEAMK
ncbi:unnamed protein product, partial [Mesorhabditis spiculigera]